VDEAAMVPHRAESGKLGQNARQSSRILVAALIDYNKQVCGRRLGFPSE